MVIIGIKCMINLMHLNHPNPDPSSLWENCLLQNWSLVSKRLGTAALADFLLGENLAETLTFLHPSGFELGSVPRPVPSMK